MADVDVLEETLTAAIEVNPGHWQLTHDKTQIATHPNVLFVDTLDELEAKLQDMYRVDADFPELRRITRHKTRGTYRHYGSSNPESVYVLPENEARFYGTDKDRMKKAAKKYGAIKLNQTPKYTDSDLLDGWNGDYLLLKDGYFLRQRGFPSLIYNPQRVKKLLSQRKSARKRRKKKEDEERKKWNEVHLLPSLCGHISSYTNRLLQNHYGPIVQFRDTNAHLEWLTLIPKRIKFLEEHIDLDVFEEWEQTKQWLERFKPLYVESLQTKDPPPSNRSLKADTARRRNKAFRIFFTWWRKQVAKYHPELDKELCDVTPTKKTAEKNV